MKRTIVVFTVVFSTVLALAGRVPKPQLAGPELGGTRVEVPALRPGYRVFDGWTQVGAKPLHVAFPAASSADRATWDFPIKGNLASTGSLAIDFFTPDAENFGGAHVYLKSGAGWYRTHVRLLVANRWIRTVLTKGDFRHTEGTPAGWRQIDGLRVTFPRPAQKGDVALDLAMANVSTRDVAGAEAVVVCEANNEGGEYAARFSRALTRLGVTCVTVDEQDLPTATFGTAVLVLPLNPRMKAPAIAAVARHVAAGGRALAAGGMFPAELQRVLGVKVVGPFWRERDETSSFRLCGFAKAEHGLAGQPAFAPQDSWQTTRLTPSGAGRVLAWWADAQERPSSLPGILETPTGIVLGHVWLGSDDPRSVDLLAALVMHLAPTVGTRLAAAQKAEADRAAAVKAWVRDQPPKADERRLMWCHSPLGLTRNGDWDASVQALKACGYTDLIANLAWAYCTDFKTGGLVPESAAVRQKGDCLETCLAACRKHGIRLHMWLVCGPVGRSLDAAPRDQLDAAGRLQYDVHGKRVHVNNMDWLCPSAPENRAVLKDVMLAALAKGVDGIHFDYIRYPCNDGCYCARCRARFEKILGRPVAAWPQDVLPKGRDRAAWSQFRTANITAIVREVHTAAKARFPDREISAAVFNQVDRTAETVGQDWASWLDEGLVDFVCPMDYTPWLDAFEVFLRTQKARVGTAKVYPGIGVTSSASLPIDSVTPLRFVEQVLATRDAGFPGFTCFNFDPKALNVMRLAHEGPLK